MMRYWTVTQTLYCFGSKCLRQTRQVVENQVQGDQLEKKATCYRCGRMTKSVGPLPRRPVDLGATR